MDSTTTTIRSPDREPRRGFTLVEVMVSATLGTMILAAVLSMFLFLGRTSANIVNYAEMEAQTRSGLERFAQDTRQSSDITWNSANSITLEIGATTITYTHNSTTEEFSRTTGGNTEILLDGITSFIYSGYKITGASVDLSDLSTVAKRQSASDVTKQVQIYIEAARQSTTATRVTNTVLSARYILRNKRVTA